MGKTEQQLQVDPASTSELEGFIGYNLKRAYVITHEDFRSALGEDGLAPRVFSALSLVVQFPQITQSLLARRLGIERSGLVAIVDTLEQRGYVQRRMVPGDRRVQALVPTDAGIAAHASALQAVRDHEQRLFADFTQAEQDELMRLLRKLRQGREPEADPA